jgi:hypothetical protein
MLIVPHAAEYGISQHATEQSKILLLLPRRGLLPESPKAESCYAIDIDDSVEEGLQALAPRIGGTCCGHDRRQLIANTPYVC